MKVLVIGGTGWVGHNVALAFEHAGHEVEILCRGRGHGFDEEVSFLPRHQGDKTDRAFLAGVLEAGEYDVVVDSVPVPAVIETLAEMPDSYGRYLHCGSTGVCTPLQYLPADEEHPFATKSYEGFGGKVRADQAVFDHSEELRWTILRPCCIAGPGKFPLDNIGGRRPDFLKDLREGKEIDLPGDGSVPLQIVHVKDLARAFVQAAESGATYGEVYHICGAHALPLWRYCEVNAEAVGGTLRWKGLSFDGMIAKYGEEIRGGLTFLVEPMCFTTEKARNDFGFAPEFTTEGAIRDCARAALFQLS